MANIIVVDDEPSHRDMVVTLLIRAGYGVRAVEGANECLAMLGTGSADLVITDIFMSGMDGFQLIAVICSTYNRLPVIGMTGEWRKLGLTYGDTLTSIGRVRILSKPFSAEDLLGAVKASLERQS